MKSRIALLLLALTASSLRAQILAVDAAGVEGLGVISRDITIGAADTKLDFGKRTASFTYLQALSGMGGGREIRLYGLHTKVAIPEEWDEAFKRSPDVSIDALLNLTRNVPGEQAGTNWFATLVAGGSGESLRWRNDASSAVQSDYHWTWEARATAGASWPSTPWSTAISIGATRTSNQADLAEVEADGRTIREGSLGFAHAYPVTARVNYQSFAEWIERLARQIPRYDSTASYSAVVGAYATYESREGQADHRVLGLSLSLQQATAPKTGISIPGGVVPAQQLSYWKPLWNVYYERRKRSGAEGGENKVGAAIVFDWPR